MSSFSHTVRLTQSGLAWLTAKLAKWPQIEVLGQPVVVKDEWDVETIVFNVQVSLNAPVIAGHTLLARIEHHDEGNIVYRCAGPEREAYRTCKSFCDHCRTDRRRNDTFVLSTPADGEVRVGRNCLAEYCRDAEAAAYLLSWASDLDRIIRTCSEAEEGYSTGRAPETFTLPFCLSWALAYGGRWVSASQAREAAGELQASAWVILNMIDQKRFHRDGDTFWETREGKLILETEELASTLRADPTSSVYRTIAWIESLASKSELSDYEHNLTVIARIGYCTRKQWSFTCSAFRAWLRSEHIARGEEQAKAAAGPKGQHLGTKGERLGFSAVNCVENKSLGVGDFGERFLVKFITTAGDELVWFTTTNPFETGKQYDITGTVKDHNEFRGQRSTVLNRVAEGLPKVKKTKKVK